MAIPPPLQFPGLKRLQQIYNQKSPIFNYNHPMRSKFLLTGFALLLLVLLALSLRLPGQAAPLAQLTVFPTPTPGPDGRIIYIATKDDTLWRVAAIAGLTVDQLKSLNNLTSDVLQPGQQLLLGLAGPALITPTVGPSATPAAVTPTATAGPGWGVICVLLYEDENGDSLRQEEEASLLGGAISVSDRLGRVSLTADTPSGGFSDAYEPEPEELGYTCFDQLAEGEYSVTVAIPEGYNPTTVLNRSFTLKAGDETLLAFGAQANTQTAAETAIIPEAPNRSPLLGIAGGLLLLVGAGLGFYAYFLRRARSVKID